MNVNKKCSLKKHSEIDAISFCVECNVYMCNKCLNYHNEFLENHHKHNIDKNIQEIFTGICKEEDHKKELYYYCKTHNVLCCVACISKIKGKGNGQHSDCEICFIEDIKNEKKNILNENIKNLEEFSKTIDNSIKELKQILEKVNKDKEELKMEIIQKFTKMRNTINEREDKLLSEIDNKFNELFFQGGDDIIKKSEKFPDKIKNALIKGKQINNDWDNNNDILNSKINDCIQIENSIKLIKNLNDNIKKYNEQNSEIKFITNDEDDFNDIITKIINFGGIINKEPAENIFKFKFKNGMNYSVSENGLIATKNSGEDDWNCTIIGDKEIPKNKITKWKIKLNNFIIKSNTINILIGIGPNNPNNEDCFYRECWAFCCGTSEIVIKSNDSKKYKNHSGKLKEGDIIEVTVDRISGNLSFAVNDLDYGIACSQIPKEDILYPIILINDQNQIVEIVQK